MRRPCARCDNLFEKKTRHSKLCGFCFDEAKRKGREKGKESYSKSNSTLNLPSRKLKCPFCSERFFYKVNYKQHLKRIHSFKISQKVVEL